MRHVPDAILILVFGEGNRPKMFTFRLRYLEQMTYSPVCLLFPMVSKFDVSIQTGVVNMIAVFRNVTRGWDTA